MINIRLVNKWRWIRTIPRVDIFDIGVWVDEEYCLYICVLNFEVRIEIGRKGGEMKKTVRAWACLNKRGTFIEFGGTTKQWSERLMRQYFGEDGWASLQERGHHLVPGIFAYDDGKKGD